MDSYPEQRGKATKTHARAPGLDGVRALAVLAVMGFHAAARIAADRPNASAIYGRAGQPWRL